MKYLVIGTNFISDLFASAIGELEGERCLAVYSRKEETGWAFAERWGIERVYTSYGEALCDPDIDAVYVASPTFLHKEHAVKAMRCGKQVLCEKMMAATLSEFYEMKKVSEECSAVLLEAMRPSHDPMLSLVREELKSLGRVSYGYFNFSQYSRRYDAFKEGRILNAFNPALKNSAVSDIGIYPLSLAASLFGMPIGIGGESTLLHNGFEGEGSITLTYSDKKIDVSYSKIREDKSPSFIECERGTLYIDKISETKRLWVVQNGNSRDIVYTPSENNMIHEIRAFSAMCRGEGSHKEFLSTTEITQKIVDYVYRTRGIDKYFG